MKILLAKADPSFCEALLYCLEKKRMDAEIRLVDSGAALLDTVNSWRPDLLILDTILPDSDGLTVLRAIRAMSVIPQPELIIISSYCSWALQQEVCSARPLLYISLPCDAGWLADRILNCCREMVCRFPKRCDDEQSSIRHILREVGMNSRCKGFAYAQTAVCLILKADDYHRGLTKILYPTVARLHHTSSANVERAIRSAVLSAWQKEGFVRQRELFAARPANGEFLLVLAEQVKENCAFAEKQS